MHTMTIRAFGLALLLSAPVLTWAQTLDAETARLEAAALCQAMPYTCPQGAAHTTPDDSTAPAARSAPGTTKAPHNTRLSPVKAARQPSPTVATSTHPATPTTTIAPVSSPAPPAWPAAKDAIDTMVYGCARAAGIDPHGTINTSQFLALTSCVDRRIGR